ncbi:MAG TPA: alkaline phosphatase D family protein [Pirellulales bacterium]|nr:alkaline phosphatase D family protein [Pirellulales bacterium]
MAAALVSCRTFADEFQAQWPAEISRPWAGGDFWTNPLEDWRLRNGRVENSHSGGNRNVVHLTAELTDAAAGFAASVKIDQLSERLSNEGFVGFELGLQGRFGDYRDSAIYGAGFAAGATFDGRLFIGAPETEAPRLELPFRNVTLELTGESVQEGCQLTLRALDPAGRELAHVKRNDVHRSWLPGLVALAASTKGPAQASLNQPRPEQRAPLPQARGGEGRFAFSEWKLSGEQVQRRPERSFGPLLWTTYTLTNEGSLKLLVQLAPVDFDEATVKLELDGRAAGEARVEPRSRTALLRAEDLDVNSPHEFAVVFVDQDGSVSRSKGTIRRVPRGPRVTAASLSCNDATGFPHNDLVRNVTAQRPNIVTFHGDQIYEEIGGYGLVMGDSDRSTLSYLRKYYMHGWTWRELLRDIPSVTIPDDHDVFHGNLWGCGGKRADMTLKAGYEQQDSGGYKQPPVFVNAVHRTQTGNLPDPVDPAPCKNGISVYFTVLDYGPLDIAIVADRQWKSAPKGLLPEAKIENGWPQNLQWDPKTQAFHPDAQLLGPRQEKFLADWAVRHSPKTPFRLVVSQSPWCAPQTLPEEIHHDKAVPSLPVYKPGEYAPNDEPKPDFDTNGWPQNKRDLALRLLKQAGALHITGDQHLGSTGQYGIDADDDGPWWISSPATANTWPRRWMPMKPGRNRQPGAPRYTGGYEDGFGNKMTIHAIANPHDIDREPGRLFDRAVGYTITAYEVETGKATLANWPYWAAPDLPAPDNAPYPGWPIEIQLASPR